MTGAIKEKEGKASAEIKEIISETAQEYSYVNLHPCAVLHDAAESVLLGAYFRLVYKIKSSAY